MKERGLRFLITSALLLCATVAFALDLQDAKQQGLVGEQRDGYVGIVTSRPSTEVVKLINEVNTARRQNYETIAKKNNLQVLQVEKLAAEKAIQKTQSGHFIQAADGSWVKK